MRRTCAGALWAIAAAGWLSGPAGASLPSDLKTESGLVRGTAGVSPDMRVFKRIPFAAPPVGANRWRPPQPVPKWDGVLKTIEFGPRCMQGDYGSALGDREQPATSEDCLYLNVWTTAESADDGRPVMFWVYGGGLTNGAGSEPRYDGEAFARKGVVLVTINYRLGPFGFFAHPGLSAESGHGASGNYGLMDVMAALGWVRRNIAAFGGDPNNITVFGESAGARLTSTLVGLPAAKGMFRRAIIESGSFMGLSASPMQTLDEAERAGQQAATALGAKSIADLRALSAGRILAGIRGGTIVVDGHLVPEDLSRTFAAGRENGVDILVGSNANEGTFFGRDKSTKDRLTDQVRRRFGQDADGFLSLYPASTDAEAARSSLESFNDEVAWVMGEMAEEHAAHGNTSYAYYFTRVPPAPRPQLGATHVAEVAYAFGHIPQGSPWTDADRRLADAMSSYWVDFARTGNPNGPGLPFWPRYRNGGAGQVMVLGEDGPRPTAAPLLPVWKRRFFDTTYAGRSTRNRRGDE